MTFVLIPGFFRYTFRLYTYISGIRAKYSITCLLGNFDEYSYGWVWYYVLY